MQAERVFSSSLAILLRVQLCANVRGRLCSMGAAVVLLTWDVRDAIGLG
jgi:hypothetical protein